MNPDKIIARPYLSGLTNHAISLDVAQRCSMQKKARSLESKIPLFGQGQEGMTLVEVMIALLIGAFLIAGVIQVFVSTRETYRMQEALSRLQENGRFAMDFLARDIRQADFRLCPTRTFIITGTNGAGVRDGLQGTNGALNGANQDDPDSITVRWSEVNCNSNVINTSSFTIATTAATGIRELRRTTGAAQPLVEGVENMQIKYGVDTDNDGTPNYYGDAGTVTLAQMAQVVSVRVSLLLYTIERNAATARLVYRYNDDPPTTPNDRRIRRVFTSTFVLRNRVG